MCCKLKVHHLSHYYFLSLRARDGKSTKEKSGRHLIATNIRFCRYSMFPSAVAAASCFSMVARHAIAYVVAWLALMLLRCSK